MLRVTLRLPDELHQRLRAVCRRQGTSLNQLVIAALSEALAREEGGNPEDSSLMEQVHHIRTVLGDLTVELDPGQLPLHLRPGDDLPDRASFIHSLPDLVPPLSATIVANREDCF